MQQIISNLTQRLIINYPKQRLIMSPYSKNYHSKIIDLLCNLSNKKIKFNSFQPHYFSGLSL